MVLGGAVHLAAGSWEPVAVYRYPFTVYRLSHRVTGKVLTHSYALSRYLLAVSHLFNIRFFGDPETSSG